jgi:hypothetical protein
VAVPDRRGPSSASRLDRAVSTAGSARRQVDRGVEVLRSLVPLALKISRAVGAFVVVVGLAATTIVVTLLWRFWPGSWGDVLAHLVVAALLFAPVAALWLFHSALREAVQIPARLAAMPDVAREHGGELASLVRAAQARRGGLRLAALPRDLWRAGRLLLAAHDDLPGYGAVLTLVSVPFLLVSLAAACVGVVEILLAPAVVAGAVLTAVV